jgi:ABC-type uncharacterized transport system substrate-binding protein
MRIVISHQNKNMYILYRIWGYIVNEQNFVYAVLLTPNAQKLLTNIEHIFTNFQGIWRHGELIIDEMNRGSKISLHSL